MNVQKLNENPLERLCHRLLKEKGQQPDPTHLFSLQVAKYLLEKYDLLGPWEVQQESLIEQVDLMFGVDWNPERVQKFLHGDLTLQSLKEKGLQAIGTYLVENLYENLSYNTPKL